MELCETLILGAGAAGLFCAGSLIEGGARGVVLVDQARGPGEKIRISGGGRCNFTNFATTPERFLSGNPRFAASALARYTPGDFVALVDRAGIAWHEKAAGQLFCDGRATQIVDMLVARAAGAQLRLDTRVTDLTPSADGFVAATSGGPITARRVVIATGGKSIPKMGASGVGLDLARGLGLPLTGVHPGLVPLILDPPLAGLAGISVTATAAASGPQFTDGLLFTHRGLSGPAVLQASSTWRPGAALHVDLAPGHDVAAALREARSTQSRRSPATVLATWLPERLAVAVVDECGTTSGRMADLGNPTLDRLAERVNRWTPRPVASEGWRTAEVMVGGVDTAAIDGRSFAARAVPGLYLIGEVLDVTGWLGGYNFQWAWASGDACAKAILAG